MGTGARGYFYCPECGNVAYLPHNWDKDAWCGHRGTEFLQPFEPHDGSAKMIHAESLSDFADILYEQVHGHTP
jgi:hypothetical protein